MVKVDLSKKNWQIVTLIGLAFIWGSSFILMKKGLASFSNIQVAAIRIFVSFLVLLPVIKKNYHRLTLKNIRALYENGRGPKI